MGQGIQEILLGPFLNTLTQIYVVLKFQLTQLAVIPAEHIVGILQVRQSHAWERHFQKY